MTFLNRYLFICMHIYMNLISKPSYQGSRGNSPSWFVQALNLLVGSYSQNLCLLYLPLMEHTPMDLA